MFVILTKECNLFSYSLHSAVIYTPLVILMMIKKHHMVINSTLIILRLLSVIGNLGFKINPYLWMCLTLTGRTLISNFTHVQQAFIFSIVIQENMNRNRSHNIMSIQKYIKKSDIQKFYKVCDFVYSISNLGEIQIYSNYSSGPNRIQDEMGAR